MTRPFIIGLTGSIGMGKSTTAGFFADAGVPVWDADAAVHRLYASGGGGVDAMRSICPQSIVDGGVSREALRDWIASDPTALAQIEAVIHPLVAADRATFIKETEAAIIVLDIPLLFEKHYESEMDVIVVVTAPPEVQRARVLERPTMTPARFEAILEKQMPDSEKRARADYVVETNSKEETNKAVLTILAKIRSETKGGCQDA